VLFSFKIARVLSLLLIQNVDLIWAFVSLIILVVVLSTLDRVILIERIRLLIF